MKTLLRLTILASILVSLNANASFNIKSVILSDSTVINGAEISAITLNNSDSTINSIETVGGELINASNIKLINLHRTMFGGGDSGDNKANRGGNDSGDSLIGNGARSFGTTLMKSGGSESGG
jgi:hypothetical protein